MSDESFAFFLFSLVAAVTPGPSNVMIMATGAAVGMRRDLPCALGAATGMASLIFCAALGMGQFVLGQPLLLKVMNLLGAAFLLWLAWRIATAGPASETGRGNPVGFLGSAAFQWANPKGWLVAVGAIGTYLQPRTEGQLLQAAEFGALFFLGAFPSGLAWLALGTLLQQVLRNERRARVFNALMGLALAASVGMMFW